MVAFRTQQGLGKLQNCLQVGVVLLLTTSQSYISNIVGKKACTDQEIPFLFDKTPLGLENPF